VCELNEKPDARISRKEPNLLTAEELDRFLEIAERDWDQHYALILVLFTTTMRLSTALALRRDDLDLETMEFIVRRRLSTGVETPGVKRDRFGEDSPPLLPEVHEALKEHWAMFTPIQEASELMFPSKQGTHHSRSVLVKPFEDILLKAGIAKRFTPHGCRRTGAKLYGKTAGTRMAMDIAGHLTDEMHRHYTPALAAEKQAAARSAFGGLRLLRGDGGREKVGIEVGGADQNRRQKTGEQKTMSRRQVQSRRDPLSRSSALAQTGAIPPAKRRGAREWAGRFSPEMSVTGGADAFPFAEGAWINPPGVPEFGTLVHVCCAGIGRARRMPIRCEQHRRRRAESRNA
jgi:integrase-like protein